FFSCRHFHPIKPQHSIFFPSPSSSSSHLSVTTVCEPRREPAVPGETLSAQTSKFRRVNQFRDPPRSSTSGGPFEPCSDEFQHVRDQTLAADGRCPRFARLIAIVHVSPIDPHSPRPQFLFAHLYRRPTPADTNRCPLEPSPAAKRVPLAPFDRLVLVYRSYSRERHLKDEIERLIRAGYLKEFVYQDRAKGRGRRRCREDSEERSDRDEEGGGGDGRDGQGKKSMRDGDREGHGREAPMKKWTIYMISGGPTNGGSNRARKEHARAVKRKREEVGITTRMPVISFKAEDAEGVVLSHNDALVITAEVAGFDVKRVFIDTGSSVDVMFYDCFVQINKEFNMELKPVTTAFYGFNGGEVVPMGEVSLPVALGAGELRKVRMVRFVVVGAESSYNIIMGRTSLNAFQAVVSTYHMTIKYP
ncbi:Unknown protein, partial [Striga hermonthica]